MVYKKPKPPKTPAEKLLPVAAVLFAVGIAVAALVFVPPLLAAPQPKVPLPQPAAYATPRQHPIDNRPTLVLDAGHGGKDPGALDPSEAIQEAVLNQQMADRLRALLKPHESELRVVLSHEPGSYMPVLQRAAVAARENADLLLSLHLNSDRSTAVRGFQVFAPPPGWLYHDQSTSAARLLAAEVQKTELPVMGLEGLFYTVYTRNAAGGYQQEVLDAGWYQHLEPRRGETFGVLEYAGCPALLVEQWYISSEEDMELCNTPAGKAVMAQCLYLAVCGYFQLEPVVTS